MEHINIRGDMNVSYFSQYGPSVVSLVVCTIVLMVKNVTIYNYFTVLLAEHNAPEYIIRIHQQTGDILQYHAGGAPSSSSDLGFRQVEPSVGTLT